MHNLGLVEFDEPFSDLLTQGMVLNEIFFRNEETGRITYFNPADVDIQTDDQGKRSNAILREDNNPVEFGGVGTMSKSKNNGVDPQTAIDKHGADTVRLFTMFAAPPEQTLEWSDDGVSGAHRFLRKLWTMVHSHLDQAAAGGKPAQIHPESLNESHKDLRRKTHETINKVNDDYGRRNTFNTAIAAVMELLNEVAKHSDNDAQSVAVRQEALNSAVLLLAPIAPHICHSLWSALGNSEAVADAAWPKLDESALVRSSIELVVQVNGKVRGKIQVAADASKESIEELALADSNVQRFTDGVTIRKVIVVPGRLVNIVAN